MIDEKTHSTPDYRFLTGKLIISMPFMPDPRFTQAVIYVCGHDSTGAMGLIINKPLITVTFRDLLEQMSIPHSNGVSSVPVHYGGPVEVGRGFVLHTTDYLTESTVFISGNFALTATLDILRSISTDQGPEQAMLALGYVGWSTNQLEQEIQENYWLIIDATPDLVFHENMDNVWRAAMASIGVDPETLSLDSGHA